MLCIHMALRSLVFALLLVERDGCRVVSIHRFEPPVVGLRACLTLNNDGCPRTLLSARLPATRCAEVPAQRRVQRDEGSGDWALGFVKGS